jgi:hypothetical protein|tara:strand:+ start:25 stop:552 length:528 start_codon:yes stop_codon:yes gene_type:complete
MTQTPGNKIAVQPTMADHLQHTTTAVREQIPEVSEVNLADIAGPPNPNADASPLEEGTLISFDQLVMNFLQQHHDTLEDYQKLQEALDNMHYTSTITKISLEDLQEKKDHLNKLTGAIEALALYKKHVDPNCTTRDFVFNDEIPTELQVSDGNQTTLPDTTVDQGDTGSQETTTP